MASLTRRILIGSSAGAVVMAGASLLACNTLSDPRQARYDRLDLLLDDIVDPIRIGRAFRAAVGESRLADYAAHSPWIAEITRIDCPATRRALWHETVRADFRSGNVVLCDRFVLSNMECVVAGLRYDRRIG